MFRFSCLLLALAGTASAQTIHGLGSLPGEAWSGANAISADGSTVVGYSGAYGFRWNQSTGMNSIAPVGSFSSTNAIGVNADGSVVAGSLEGATSAHALRWTSAGSVDIGTILGGSVARAHASSADGSILAGQSSAPSGGGAFRWTAAIGIVNIGALAPGYGSNAHGISADGSVIVGGSSSPSGSHAYRWTQGTGMVDLGTLPNGVLSVAYAVSGDGASVVGMSYIGPTSPTDYRPFRWRSQGGMINLGLLQGGEYGWANAVNASGAIVVGQNWMGSDYAAFIWSESEGLRNLRAVLISQGLDMTAWTLQNAVGVSADGLTIAGTGIGPAPGGGPPMSQAFIVTLAPPSSSCYPNCDNSTAAPVLNVNDFQCFLNRWAAADPYANCEASGPPPWFNAVDFQCFLNKFAAGCP